MRSWPSWLALAAWIAGLVGQLLLDDPRRRFPSYAFFGALSFLGWWVLGSAGARGQLPNRVLGLTLGAAFVFRAWGLFLTPAFSEDVYRHIYEGKVARERGPGFPFIHPPASAPALGVPGELTDESWLRINHASTPTIYPPLAQATFVLGPAIARAVGLAELLVLKMLLVLAELLGLLLLFAASKRRGRGSGSIVFALACPTLILEVAREGHADSLAFLGLALFCFAFSAERTRLGYLGLALAALAKLNGLVLLPAALRSTRRGFVAALPAFSLLLLPIAFAGAPALTGLFEYATRWRAGDGVFSLLLGVAEWVLGGDHIMVEARAVTRHMLARALSLIVFSAATLAVLWRPVAVTEAPDRAGTVLLLLLLLAPTLHPWYSIWLLPFLVYGGRDQVPIAALVGLAWLGHHSSWLDLGPGWADLPELRLLIHLPVWVCFLAPRLLAGKRGDMLRAPSGGESWDSSKR